MINFDKNSMKSLKLDQVKIQDKFWTRLIRINRDHTIPYQYKQCKDTGRIDSFKLEKDPGKHHIFWDSDVAKLIEAASYSLAVKYNAKLDNLLDELIKLIVSAQRNDGYLNSYYNSVELDKRWTNLRDNHELYCAGHLIEAAVAHFESTGKRTLLNAVCKYVDYIDTVFGRQPGKKRGYCGHPEIELALVKLYRITGNKKYLDLSYYFVDERGHIPHYYDIEAKERGEDPKTFWAKNYEYCQAHIPLIEQKEVVGHAVRAMYIYSAMADLAFELGDNKLRHACETLWNDLVSTKMYITGGIGCSRNNEGFTTAYDLPNETAYAETCAAIGLVMFAHRMAHLTKESKYIDVLEQALYNGVISGISFDGKKYFYENPLASKGNHHRQEWFGCACCPPNLSRLIASLGKYIYSQDNSDIYVHLYISGSATFFINNSKVVMYQQSNYPWDGKIKLYFSFDQPQKFTLKLRIPGWCKKYSLKINRKTQKNLKNDKGYICITKTWLIQDKIELVLSMPVERIVANLNVISNIGRVALKKGPIVYCLEGVDNPVPLERIVLPKKVTIYEKFDKTLFNGVITLKANAFAIVDTLKSDRLYRVLKDNEYILKKVNIKLIPYAFWDNRGPGEMLVWIRQEYF